MTAIATMQHDLSCLDQRHLGLLTIIVIVWFAAAWVGERLRECSDPVANAAVLGICLILVAATIVDPWLGLASLQVPLFVWKGYRSGSFV